MEIFVCVLLSMIVVTWGLPQYIEPAEIEGHLDDAYQFAYAVASPEHGDYHGHQQSRDENGFTSGSYYLLGADGQWSQTIFADKGLGYQALYNQRPAGAPPPQVSEVTYQVFVHPGATAISAQGGSEAPAQALPFGGIQQKSLTNQQQQNNQIAQSQNRQPSRRFNRNTQVPVSANQHLIQSEKPRFNRDTLEPQEQRPHASLRVLKDMDTSASINSPIVVERVLTPVIAPEQRPRASLRVLKDMDTSALVNSPIVVKKVMTPVVAPEQRPQASLRVLKNMDTSALVNSPIVVEKVLTPVVAPEQRPHASLRVLKDIDTTASINSPIVVERVLTPVVAQEQRPRAILRGINDIDTPASVKSPIFVKKVVKPVTAPHQRPSASLSGLNAPVNSNQFRNSNQGVSPMLWTPRRQTRRPLMGNTRYGMPKPTSIFNEDISTLLRMIGSPMGRQ